MKWTKFEIGLLSVNLLFSVYFLISGGDFGFIPILGFIANASNTVCVILVAKRLISNYYWGIVGVLAYGIVSFYYANTGEWMLNILYYLPMQFIGLLAWKNSNQDAAEEVEPRKLSTKSALLVYSITAALVVAYAWLIAHPTLQMFMYGVVSDFPVYKYLIDSSSTVLSIVAMVLMIKRYQEQWVLWIIVDVASIALWILTFDAIMILLWTTLLVNAVYGYIKWRPTKV